MKLAVMLGTMALIWCCKIHTSRTALGHANFRILLRHFHCLLLLILIREDSRLDHGTNYLRLVISDNLLIKITLLEQGLIPRFPKFESILHSLNI